MKMNLKEITKRLALTEKNGKRQFFVDGKFVFEDEMRDTFTNVWHDLTSCGLDYLDGGKTLEGFLDHFEYTKDGNEEQGRKSFDYCKRVYEAFEAAGVDIEEIWALVME